MPGMDETLILLAKDVRGKTLRLLEGVDDAQARFAAPGLQNSILWHAGHAYVVVEALGASRATGTPPVYPDGWYQAFSWESKPAAVTAWPALAEVKSALAEQLARLVGILEALTPENLARSIGDPSKGRTLRWSIMHGLHDEANHQGEIWLLRKLHARGG